MKYEVIETERLHDGHLKVDRLSLQHDLIAGGRTGTITRELVRRRSAVAVLLIDSQMQHVVVVEQFRVGAIDHCHPWVLEPVAGLLEPGEDPIETAAREVKEETGLEARNFRLIATYLSSVGGSNEKTHLYVATVDLRDFDQHLPRGLESEGEDIQPRVMQIHELIRLIETQEVVCASLLIATQWLKTHFENKNPASQIIEATL